MDWECPECGDWNRAEAHHCWTCGEPRPASWPEARETDDVRVKGDLL